MQFITNGPDIPDALLQAHEEGRVVFFCGAGISYPAGLPGFKGLVDEIYRLTAQRPRTSSARHSSVGSSTPRSTCWSGACRVSALPCAARWHRL